MYSCVTWIPKGVAQAVASHQILTEEEEKELAEASKQLKTDKCVILCFMKVVRQKLIFAIFILQRCNRHG